MEAASPAKKTWAGRNRNGRGAAEDDAGHKEQADGQVDNGCPQQPNRCGRVAKASSRGRIAAKHSKSLFGGFCAAKQKNVTHSLSVSPHFKLR